MKHRKAQDGHTAGKQFKRSVYGEQMGLVINRMQIDGTFSDNFAIRGTLIPFAPRRSLAQRQVTYYVILVKLLVVTAPIKL